jgi:alpha-beta hydrolase superfamily lysophospholipase
VSLGVSLAEVPESLTARGTPRGARVTTVAPGSAAASAGLQTGDVLVRLGRDTVTDVADALTAVRAVVAGTRVPITVVRGGARQDLAFIGRERPRETSSEFEIVYTAVAADGGRRRVLVTHPRDGARHPAVLLLGGIGCYSVDQPAGPDAYRDLLYHLTRRGYVTIRVEKAGIGDSEGGPCLSTDFTTEMAGYHAALAAARRYPWVVADRIVLFGHSIGGLAAPLVASRDSGPPPLRGIVVLSTVGINWYEYELANLRRQLLLQQLPPDSVERDMRLKIGCGYQFLIERDARAALLSKEPECEPFVAYPASDAYMQQVASYAPGPAWRDIGSASVLVLCAGSDFITSCDEHEQLTAAINTLHPGAATFTRVPEIDHYIAHQASPAASFADRTPALSRPYYGATLEPILDAWLDAKLR